MKIYVIKIAVRGVSPMVWRRIRIAADTSLAALHFIIQIVQGWGDDYLHQFHIYGKDYGISYEGGIGFPDNPFRVVIDDFAFDTGDRFTYEYNFFEHWLHDIRIEAIHENSTLKTPFCMDGRGMPGATVADEADKTLAFLEAIVNADDAATVGDIRPFIDDLDAVRFICQQMCRLLKAVRLNRRRQQGAWGSRAELDEAAHRYTQRLAEGIMDNGIFIGGDEQNSYRLYDYAEKHYAWAMR